MSADMEATGDHKLDPNYAIICSFIEHFAKLFYDESVSISIQDLDSFLKAESVDTDSVILRFHVKLLNGIGNTTKLEQWEKGLIKFSADFPERDDKLIKKLNYIKIPAAAKLRILKNLCEDQFQYNDKFNVKVNKLEEDDIRNVSLGSDRKGRTYWCIMDKKGSIRVYRSFRDDFTCQETWCLLCSDVDELKNLIEFLETYGDSEEDPQLPKDLAIPGSKLLFKKEFLQITEEDVEDIVADTKNPNQMYYKQPKARTSLQIKKDEKKNKLRHCFIKLSAKDQNPAEDSLKKLQEERKLEELAGNTEKVCKTEISNKTEKKSNTEEAGGTDNRRVEDTSEMKDVVKSLKQVRMENQRSHEGSGIGEAGRTYEAGKKGIGSETEETGEMEETDKTTQAGVAEEGKKLGKPKKVGETETSGNIKDAYETVNGGETEDASETEEALKMGKAGKSEKPALANKAVDTDKIDKVCGRAGIISQAAKDKESKTHAVCENGFEIGSSRVQNKDETCVKGKDINLPSHKNNKLGIHISENKTRTNNSDTKVDMIVPSCEEMNQKEFFDVKERSSNCTRVESEKDETHSAISIDKKCEQAALVSNIAEHQDMKDKSFSENGENFVEFSTKSSDVAVDPFECEKDMQETLKRILELSGAFVGSKNKTEMGKEDTRSAEDNTKDLLQVSDKSCTVMSDSSSLKKGKRNEISAVDELNKKNETKAFDEALEGLKTLGNIIGQGNTILATEIRKGDKFEKDNNIIQVSELEALEGLQTLEETVCQGKAVLATETSKGDKLKKEESLKNNVSEFDEALDGLQTLENIIGQGNAILASETSKGDKVKKEKSYKNEVSEFDEALEGLQTLENIIGQGNAVLASETSKGDKVKKEKSYKNEVTEFDKALEGLETLEETVCEGKAILATETSKGDNKLKKEKSLKNKVSEFDEALEGLQTLENIIGQGNAILASKTSKEDKLEKDKSLSNELSELKGIEHNNENFKSEKQDMNDLRKIHNCEGLDVKQRNLSEKSIPECRIKQDKNPGIPIGDTPSESIKYKYDHGSQMAFDENKCSVKEEDGVGIVQHTKDNENREEEKLYKDAFNLKRDVSKNYRIKSICDDKLEGVEVDEKNVVCNTDCHTSATHDLRNETATKKKGNTADFSGENSKEERSGKTVKMVVDGDMIEINELSSSSESEEEKGDMNTDKTVQEKVSALRTVNRALENNDNTCIEHAYSNLDKTKRLAKEALHVLRERILMDRLPLVTSSVPLKPRNLVPESTKVSELASDSISDDLLSVNSIAPVSTVAQQSTTMIVPQSNFQTVKRSAVSLKSKPSVKIVPQSNVTTVPKSNVLPQSSVSVQSSVVSQSSVLPRSSVLPWSSVATQSSLVRQLSALPQSGVLPRSGVKPVSSVVPQSSKAQSSVVPHLNIAPRPRFSATGQSIVTKPAPPVTGCRSMLQNYLKKCSSFTSTAPNSSVTLPISTYAGSQNLNKIYNTVNLASDLGGNFPGKQTGSQVLHTDLGQKIIVGPGMKCYDAQTGIDVNITLNSTAFPSIRPGSTFILVRKLNEKFQNKQQTFSKPQNILEKSNHKPWPKRTRVKRTQRSLRGRGRGRRVEDLDDSSDSEEFVPMDSDDSDYDYDGLSRRIHAAVEKKNALHMRLPKFLHKSDETNTESCKRDRRQREAVNYNEDDVEISDSDVDVQTVAEEIKVVEEKIKPKPPEKFELMEYPCTICGSSDFFATILTCADCDSTYHMACLSPPVLALPTEDWFCPQCEHEMLIENLKDKYKKLRKLLHSMERKNNKINAEMFAINKENIIHMNRSARTRKEVNYDETKFDNMVKSAVKEYNKTDEKKSTKIEKKTSSKTSSAKSSVHDSDESDHLSGTESELTDNSVCVKRETRQKKDLLSELDSCITTSRKRSAENEKSAEHDDAGPTRSKVTKLPNGGKADVKLKGKDGNKSSKKQKEKRSLRQRKEISEESDNSQERKLGQTAKNSKDADSDFVLSDSDERAADGDSDTEDYEDSSVKKEEQDENVYYTSSGRKTNSLSKLKNAY